MRTTLLLLTFLVAGSLADAADKKPNVILFMVDDMGWMDSEPYGSKYYRTPNMNRLSAESMRFTDAYALPLCSPTRASIMTGQYSARHGITSATGHQPPQPEGFSFLPDKAPANQPLLMPISKNYLDTSHYTLAEALRDAGYRTAHFGKWHLGLTAPHRPDQHGFEVTWHCAPDPGPPSYFSPYGVFPDGRPSGQHHVGNITDGPDGEHITDRLTSEAVNFIEEHADEPFFVNMWQYSVHGPWQHKEEYTAEYAKTSDPTGRQGNPVMGSMLQNVDESLGRVLDTLERLKLADNTLLIFYSDNGGNKHSWTPDDRKIVNVMQNHPKYDDIASYRKWSEGRPPTNNAPLRDGKGRIYEGGQRVPLMVRWPSKIEPGTTTDAIVGPIDLYPTILDAVGVKPSPKQIIDGESILPVLTGEGNLKRDAYFTWFPHLTPGVSVRQGDWKLIRHFKPSGDSLTTLELFNLKDDIGETTDLASTNPAKAKELNALIDKFVKQTNPTYPQPNPAYSPVSRPAQNANDDPTFGLVARGCEMNVADGVLHVNVEGRDPFLGTARVRLTGPVELKLMIRCANGGEGRVHWKRRDQEAFPEDSQQVSYTVPAGDEWHTATVKLNLEGPAGTVRLHLPKGNDDVEIRSIEYTGKNDQKVSWLFSSTKQ